MKDFAVIPITVADNLSIDKYSFVFYKYLLKVTQSTCVKERRTTHLSLRKPQLYQLRSQMPESLALDVLRVSN